MNEHTRQTIKSFLSLPKGWCYGSGIPISQITTDLAIHLNEKAENYGLKTEAFPGIDGEVLLSVYGWEEETLDITIYYGDLEYSLEICDEQVESQEFVSIEDIYELIDNLAKVDV